VEDHEHSDERIKLCNSYQELLESDVDAIVISVYAKVAADYTIKALNVGKHVLCEKPPSINAKEMQKVIEAEKASNKILKYGFNHRFHFSVMEAKKLIDGGSMGKLLWMRGVYGKAGSIDFDQNWRNYKEYSGGGILLDQGIHMLDLFRYFSVGEFECLSSYLTKSYWKTEFEDNAFLILKSKNDNVVATLHSTANQWKHKFLLEMTFEHGYVNLDGLLSSTRSYVPETLIVGRREFEDVTFAMGKPKETITYFENDRSWELELDEFIGAIRNGSSILNGTSDDALEIMKITDCIYGNSKEMSS
jgi:predicted dehydrogenase